MNEKIVYVIGHKNPDTDSCVSATAYAILKQAQGMRNVYAARAGKTTPQTDYIFHRFNVPLPQFIPDLQPRVAYYYTRTVKTVTSDFSLWDAMTLMKDNGDRTLPVVDESGRYLALLHYSFFAQRMLKINNPAQKTAIETSIKLVAGVLHAQALVMHNTEEIKKSPIIVAAAEFESFKKILGTHIPENTVVICGNRKDVQRHSIERGVRALITTNGDIVDKDLRELAEKKKVSVLSSPYDTSSTTMLIIYSMPALCMANADLQPVRTSDTLSSVAQSVSDAPGKSLPVVDAKDVVVGVIGESDLYHEPNIEAILVDHNELSQAVDGIENYKILEIIDHHRLGSITTRHPITFINKPVGATSTIVASLYQENRVPLSHEIAALLLCGILSDTLVLQSATTTEKDREVAEYLANITNLDIETLGRDIMTAASNISGRTAAELVHQDMKEYDENGIVFTVSQIEVADPGAVVDRKAEFLEELEKEREKRGGLFSAILVTDIQTLSSILVVAADERFVPFISLPRLEDSVYEMRDIVSRKKQVLPILSELVEKYRDGAEGSRTRILK